MAVTVDEQLIEKSPSGTDRLFQMMRGPLKVIFNPHCKVFDLKSSKQDCVCASTIFFDVLANRAMLMP